MMNKAFHIFLLVVLAVGFNCCKRDKDQEVCKQQTFYIPQFLKQFEFKTGSCWVYDSPNSTQIDTLKAYNHYDGFWNYPYCNTESSTCRGTNDYCLRYEQYIVTLKHRLFENPVFLVFNINYDRIYVGKGSHYNGNIPKFLVTAANDSLTTSGYINKLEQKVDSLTINGTQYYNVYQMYYSPQTISNKFQRVWWCPNIGIVKFEFINTQNQIETWNLKGSQVFM